MGKKAKLKKIRKDSASLPLPKTDVDSDKFVKNIERQGYSLKKIEHSPEIPTKRIEPQI